MRKIVVLLICLMCSCDTVRKTSDFKQNVKDSSSRQVSDSMATLQVRYHSSSSMDTTIYVAGKIASLFLSPSDLQPLYTASGKPVAREFRKDTAGMHILVHVSPDGGVAITANTDSLTMTIKGLIRERDSVALILAHSRTETAQKTHVAERSAVQSTTKRIGWFGLITRIVIGAVIGIVVIWVSFKGKAFIKLFKIIKW